MKKIALVFALAVFAPSLVLAWLAVRSVRDQQVVVAQQQTAIYQAAADSVAKDVREFISDRQREFAQIVESLRRGPGGVANRFDEELRDQWSLAEVGFTVTLDGKVLSPSLFGGPEARQFRLNNDRFLCSREPVEVYWNPPKASPYGKDSKGDYGDSHVKASSDASSNSAYGKKLAFADFSKVEPGEAEFKELVGNASEGIVARFLQDKLKVLMWYRNTSEPELVYGAQLSLTNLVAGLKPLIVAPESVRPHASVALLDDGDRPVDGTASARIKPLVSSEIGHAMPHWRVALYLSDPAILTRPARTLALTLSLIVVVMIAAIGFGGLLIAADLRRQIIVARQKTDFVSNVSHELKTPLTSIRMFSELLAEGKVADATQRQQFLHIISQETARLTRLINNVLDFARMERGEKKYNLARCDLVPVLTETVAAYRPQLEASGFTVTMTAPPTPVWVDADCDAVSQVIVNLLSNAEKYAFSGHRIDILLDVPTSTGQLTGPGCEAPASYSAPRSGISKTPSHLELRILDRGPGVPPGCEERIFEQFYRAHDSLSSGIQGSGLGLTLARQIVRAHNGEIRYEPRQGGGSAFIVTLPLASSSNA